MPESELIESAKAGDQDAWAALLESHANIIKRSVDFAVARGHDHDDATSGANTGFVQAVNEFDPSKGDFASYANRVVIGAAQRSDYGGSIRVPRNGFTTHAEDSVRATRTVEVHGNLSDAHIDTSVEDADELEAMHDSIDRLPSCERAVIRGLLAYQTHAELAEELGLSVARVKRLEAKAHERLRGMLT